MVAIVFTPEIQRKIRGIVYAREVETGVTLFGRREGAVFSVTDACGPDPLAAHGTCYSGDDYASFVSGICCMATRSWSVWGRFIRTLAGCAICLEETARP